MYVIPEKHGNVNGAIKYSYFCELLYTDTIYREDESIRSQPRRGKNSDKKSRLAGESKRLKAPVCFYFHARRAVGGDKRSIMLGSPTKSTMFSFRSLL